MTKGRNSTVVGVRLPDEMVTNLKRLARSHRRTFSELKKEAVIDLISYSNLSDKQKRTIRNAKNRY